MFTRKLRCNAFGSKLTLFGGFNVSYLFFGRNIVHFSLDGFQRDADVVARLFFDGIIGGLASELNLEDVTNRNPGFLVFPYS
jgi:hypothetical protein